MKQKSVSHKTENQKNYLKSILENDIVLCTGPAGSGKTYMSVGTAIWQMFINNTERIIISRPIISVGNKLGTLPGDVDEKIGPYMDPFFDIFNKFYHKKTLDTHLRNRTIDILPVDLMRGRTFDNCYLIVTEAQNCSKKELRQILTRIGENCKIVLEGDINQSDLPSYDMVSIESEFKHGDFIKKVPFADAMDKLYEIPKIGIVHLEKIDIQRNKIIGDIEDALGDW